MKNGIITSPDGSKSWYINDKLHRLGGPAIENANGDKVWYVDDKLHRLDGPAMEWADGYKEWWVEGIQYTNKSKYAKAVKDYKFEKEDKLS